MIDPNKCDDLSRILRTAAKKKITSPFLRTLIAVSEAEREQSEPITIGKLSSFLGCSTAACTGLIDKLEARGLIMRAYREGDRRRIFLTMQVEGTETLNEILES